MDFKSSKHKKRTEVLVSHGDFERTVVMGDLHGDLEVMLHSMVAKGLLIDGLQTDEVLGYLNDCCQQPLCEQLERLVVPQPGPVQLVFLGDLVDRYHHGCHIVLFLCKIDWGKFNIQARFLIGNHDLHNFFFFTNPFRVHRIYAESEHRLPDRLAFICSMGLQSTLSSFRRLHHREVLSIQERFYREGRLEWPLQDGKLVLEYRRDLRPLLDYRHDADLVEFHARASGLLGFPAPTVGGRTREQFLTALGAFEGGSQNWWFIEPDLGQNRDWRDGYDPAILYGNYFPYDPCQLDLPGNRFSPGLWVDWRVISLVWRRHYGPWYRRALNLHLAGETLFVHGGLSPQGLIDNLGFGVLYRWSEGRFLVPNPEVEVPAAVNRINRLWSQVLENTLNDYSFKSMSGAEVGDQIGRWRGGSHGFPEFAGFLWADFELLRQKVTETVVADLYRSFASETGIRRVICGHTRFEEPHHPELRYMRLAAMADLGLDYLCVDNSCSRGYRVEPVLTGIEIDAKGRIRDPGRTLGSEIGWSSAW